MAAPIDVPVMQDCVDKLNSAYQTLQDAQSQLNQARQAADDAKLAYEAAKASAVEMLGTAAGIGKYQM